MTIQQIKDKKKLLEVEINQLVKRFEDEAQVNVNIIVIPSYGEQSSSRIILSVSL